MKTEDPAPDAKGDIQNFWSQLYQSLYAENDVGLTPDVLQRQLDDLADMFAYRAHMASTDMTADMIRGKRVLEIGCGAGGHSALFASWGAHMTSVDITPERVISTKHKLDLLGGTAPAASVLQTDAENLPFADASFDIVYSNGVMHHTRDTERAVAEALRVLKPGGRAVILLYCKSSWHYWVNMWFVEGILRGRIWGDPNWLGKATEWGGKDTQTVENPITRCYTAGGIEKLFNGMSHLRLRKGEFYFYLIPKLGRLYRRYQLKRYGAHPGGKLVYGEDWPIQSPLELALGRVMGFAWFITCQKPD